jgi:putative tryptophan/tyrosine transport system substrate-binding protein
MTTQFLYRRREFIALLGGATVWPLKAASQQPEKISRIGFLGPASASATAVWVDALRAGLHDLGYREGKNILFEFRWAEGQDDRLPDLAADLVRRKVDVLVTYGTPGTRAAKQATTMTPIVMAVSGDAVATGLIVSLARPEANITGTTIFNPELCAKRLELLKEALPPTERVVILLNPDNPVSAPNFQAAVRTATSLGLTLQQFEARASNEIKNAFSAMASIPVDAVSIFEDAVLFANTKSIADHASAQRLPSIGYLDLAEMGGLIAYGVDLTERFRHAAIFVDKLLRGTKLDQLPVEQPTKFKLVINLKTAKALGLNIPPTLLARADEVIE